MLPFCTYLPIFVAILLPYILNLLPGNKKLQKGEIMLHTDTSGYIQIHTDTLNLIFQHHE